MASTLEQIAAVLSPGWPYVSDRPSGNLIKHSKQNMTESITNMTKAKNHNSIFLFDYDYDYMIMIISLFIYLFIGASFSNGKS